LYEATARFSDSLPVCGILGIVACGGGSVSVSEPALLSMRDRMTHRGPDGAGVWRAAGVALAHRRLAVIDPTPAGHQPMVSADGRRALVYNGELYNDAEVRDELARDGMSFHTRCDTETVLAALVRWGADAIGKLRGMYAFGFIDLDRRVLILARDPLGIKPLYYATARPARSGGRAEVVFASEIPALLEHPEITARPDVATVSAYLTTIRTTVGARTLFEGVSIVTPGEWIEMKFAADEPQVKRRDWWDLSAVARGKTRADHAGTPADQVRSAVLDSVRRHLRSDVSTCCLLSGGLDSTVICSVAEAIGRESGAERLWTYCSGARAEGVAGGARDSVPSDDFGFASLAAGALGSRHTEVPVTREMFAERWVSMISATGVPLSTPNEVAINEVARRLRADGKVVTLSGEGADELFAGYDGPMTESARHVASLAGCGGGEWRRLGGGFQLDHNAWIGRLVKPTIFNEPVWRSLEEDAALTGYYRDEFARLADQGDEPDPLQVHLRFMRRVNLSGLLLRLDSATMRESVEGRTPLADQAVATLAEGLAMSEKFDATGEVGDPSRYRTKIALRRAFENDVPREVLLRAKASFPLPFQQWVGDRAGVLRESALARELFSHAAIETVASQPEKLWQLAWPMVNVAIWSRRWWG